MGLFEYWFVFLVIRCWLIGCNFVIVIQLDFNVVCGLLLRLCLGLLFPVVVLQGFFVDVNSFQI